MIGASKSSEGVFKRNETIKTFAIALCVMTVLVSFIVIAAAAKGKDGAEVVYYYAVPIMFLGQVAIVGYMWFQGDRGLGLLDNKLFSIKKLALIDGCSDEYTGVPLNKIE